MKPQQELALMRAIRVPKHAGGKFPREAIEELGLVPKAAWRTLEKWCDKRWYDYGATLDLGWLTEAGLKKLNELELT